MNQNFYNFIKNMPLAEEAYFAFLQYKKKYTYQSVPDSPTSVMIEITNSCNLDCVMCATQKSKRKKGNMGMSLFKEIILQATAMGVKAVTVHTIGEALIHPNVVEMVGYATAKGLTTNVTTNGQLLTEEMSQGLLEAGLNTLRISAEGATEKTYSSIRKGGNLKKLINNLTMFRRIKDEKGYKTNIIINSLLMKETELETASFYNLFVPIVGSPFNIFFHNLHNQGGQSELTEIKTHLQKNTTNSTKPCGLFWSTLVVTWDGKVSACCVDFDGNLIIGDINKQTLKKIWECEQLKRYREFHLQGHPEKMPLCGNCAIIKRNILDDYKIYKLNQKWRKNYLRNNNFPVPS